MKYEQEEIDKLLAEGYTWLQIFSVNFNMTKSSWRRRSRSIIREILNESKATTIKQLKREISKSYPFHERELHPYKIWLSEVKIQMREKQHRNKKKVVDAEGQKSLWD